MKQKKDNSFLNGKGVCELWDSTEQPNICVIRFHKGEESGGSKKVLEKIISGTQKWG
jgi:hypothetical protein